LRRCSGSQFDPVVITALLDELKATGRWLKVVDLQDASHRPVAAASGE